MSWQVIRTGALVAGCYFLQAKAHAQSFDCSKASTAVEHAICEDKRLGELDETLARELKSALAAAPERRALLLADQRRWLAYRDRRCREESPLNECLAPRYSERVRHLQALMTPRAAICQKVADGYRQLGGPEVPASAPSVQHGSGMSFSLPDDLAQLHEWGRSQTPPFTVSPELMDALKSLAEEAGTIGTVDKMPGRDLYSVTHEQGTAHCLTSQFFTVTNGTARPVKGPAIFDDDYGTSCEASREFVQIGETPALTQTGAGQAPSMIVTKIVVTWDENLSSSACALTFKYAPRFGRSTYYKAEEKCDGPLCDGLRAAARELAGAVQKSPKRARERLEKRLTAAQRVEYDAAVEPLLRDRGRAHEEWPNEITDFVPLFLPYVYGGNVYVASVGHFKPYGHIFADWSVKFESFTAGKLVHSAEFPVGMERGELEDISISLKAGP